jgi:predicted dehydrogenase
MHSHSPQILLVGYGARGRQWHSACARGRVEIAGVVDTGVAAADAARQEGLEVWQTVDEALAVVRVEAAIIASPPGEHVSNALACIDAGVTPLIEKPLALSTEQAGVVARASIRAGVPVLVGQNFRYMPRERAIRTALAAAGGSPTSMSIVSARPASVVPPHVAEIANGALWDICLHHLDALRIRLGRVPDTVEATVRHAEGGGNSHYRILLDWPGGPSAVYLHSEGAPGFFHSEWIERESGAILVRDQQVSTLFPHHRPRRVRAPRRPAPEAAILAELLEAARSGQSGDLGIEDNLSTVALVEASARSIATGEAVSPAALLESASVERAV